MHTHRSIAVLLLAAGLSSCGLFEENAIKDITGPTPSTARIKFHNFSPGSVGVNFFANDAKMTAISATTCTPAPTVDSLKAKCLAAGIESATGVVYAGSGSAGLYVAIAPGQYTLASKMAAKDTIVATVSQAVAINMSYTFIMSGIYNTTTKTADAFILEDPIPTGPIDYSVAHVRFVNAISNGTGDLNLFAVDTLAAETAVGGAVAYKAAGTFMTLPEGTYNLRARYTGLATNLIIRNGLSFLGGRVYTITARGNTATASTLGLDFTENQR